MPRIVVRLDERGRHAVYRGRMLLMDGLEMGDAENFAAFFRASERVTGGTIGQPASTSGRSQARRSGVIA